MLDSPDRFHWSLGTRYLFPHLDNALTNQAQNSSVSNAECERVQNGQGETKPSSACGKWDPQRLELASTLSADAEIILISKQSCYSVLGPVYLRLRKGLGAFGNLENSHSSDSGRDTGQNRVVQIAPDLNRVDVRSINLLCQSDTVRRHHAFLTSSS